MARSYPKAERHSGGADDCTVSEKYDQYISMHIETLKKKCQHFVSCIGRLLEDVNPVNVLRGEDIGLNKTCGLIYKGGDQKYDTLDGLCTSKERNYIKEDIEDHLRDQTKPRWGRVEDCLESYLGDNDRADPSRVNVDDICKLAYDSKTICENQRTHNLVESFFNDQILHLKCTCLNLNKEDEDHSHAPVYAAAGAGAGIMLLIILIVGFICYRRRKAKKRRKKKGPNVIYLPAPNADNNPVYQEVYDDRFYSPGHPSNPPTLPLRYTRDPTARPDDEPTYLEPVEPGFRPQLPPMRGAPVANPGYDAPPKYSEKAEDTPSTRASDSENGYFQPLPPLPGEEGTPARKPDTQTSGYETLEFMEPAPPPPTSRPPTSPPTRSASEKPAEPPSVIDKSELTRSASDKPTVPRSESENSEGARLLSGDRPVPAKRTKKEEPSEPTQPAESPYFLLEREESTV